MIFGSKGAFIVTHCTLHSKPDRNRLCVRPSASFSPTRFLGTDYITKLPQPSSVCGQILDLTKRGVETDKYELKQEDAEGRGEGF